MNVHLSWRMCETCKSREHFIIGIFFLVSMLGTIFLRLECLSCLSQTRETYKYVGPEILCIFILLSFFNKLIYFWLLLVFVAACRLPLVVMSGGYSSLQCADFSLRWLLLLRSTGSRCVGFISCGAQA